MANAQRVGSIVRLKTIAENPPSFLEDKFVWVNLDHVVSMVLIPETSQGHRTELTLTQEKSNNTGALEISVIELPEEILGIA